MKKRIHRKKLITKIKNKKTNEKGYTQKKINYKN